MVMYRTEVYPSSTSGQRGRDGTTAGTAPRHGDPRPLATPSGDALDLSWARRHGTRVPVRIARRKTTYFLELGIKASLFA
jgi:hypothetical protein